MQVTFLATLLLAAAAAAAPTGTRTLSARQASGSGKATFYTPGLGSCGETNSASELVVAMADGKSECGQMATVTRVDTGAKVVVKVVDTCVRCQSEAGVDLSPAAFDKLGDEGPGHYQVTWTLGGSSSSSGGEAATTTAAAAPAATTTAAAAPAATTAASSGGACDEGAIVCNANGTWSQCGSGILQLQGAVPPGMKCTNGAFSAA